ncbi:hypothetical protein ABEF95_004490 [Exophiala dermatitidis]
MPVEEFFPGVSLVTGAAGGIGAATALAFAEAGCTEIALTDRDAAGLQRTADEIVRRQRHSKVKVLVRDGDISLESFVDSFVAEVVQQFHRVDYVVYCAGIIGSSSDTINITTDEFDTVNGVNYRGCWLLSRAVLKVMVKQEPPPGHASDRRPQRGSIVNVASQLALVGRRHAPAYVSSKAAVVALTRANAIDYATRGVRVNCVCPGLIDTQMTNANAEIQEIVKGQVAATPIERMGKVAEVADCILFLSSTKASFVVGHAMVVDGGYVIV